MILDLDSQNFRAGPKTYARRLCVFAPGGTFRGFFDVQLGEKPLPHHRMTIAPSHDYHTIV